MAPLPATIAHCALCVAGRAGSAFITLTTASTASWPGTCPAAAGLRTALANAFVNAPGRASSRGRVAEITTTPAPPGVSGGPQAPDHAIAF